MDRAGAIALARGWWGLICDLSFVSMSAGEIEQVLLGWIERLAVALTREPFDPADAGAIGQELVRANLTNPQVLGRTAQVLAELPEHCPHPDAGRRLAIVVGELGQGYAAELLATRARSQEALQWAMTEARHAVEARFRVVFDNAAVAIAVCDAAGKVIDANATLLKMLELDAGTMPRRLSADLTHPDDRAEATARVRALLRDGSGATRFESRYQRRGGDYGWAAWAITLVPAVGRREAYLLAVGEDTSQRRALQAELRHQALHDSLTGLPNRRRLLDEVRALGSGAAAGDRIGLCFVDLDQFKQVNDRFGHRVGDQLLVEAGRRLRQALDGPGRLVARIGGDEFVALLAPPCDDETVTATARALLDALAEPIAVGGSALRMSASIGALVTEVAGADAEALLDAADTGLYRAKAGGPGTWVLHRMRQQPSEP
jgi:diguanylate cyclase (GGDEF)-like protein/PAS domain S-box-containing protein